MDEASMHLLRLLRNCPRLLEPFQLRLRCSCRRLLQPGHPCRLQLRASCQRRLRVQRPLPQLLLCRCCCLRLRQQLRLTNTCVC